MIFVTFVCIFGGITFVVWVGARSVLAHDMTYGELGQFLLYAMFTAASAGSLTEMWGEVQRASGAMERMVELLRARPNIRAPQVPVPMPAPGTGRIRFENVSFNYPSRPGQQALNSFTLDIQPGERIAFVGPSGAGKSTTFQLLLRFYDPQGGRILIDGVDIARPAGRVRERAWFPGHRHFGDTAREHPLRQARPPIRNCGRQLAPRSPMTSSPSCPRAETFLGRRGAAVRRPAPAHRHCPRNSQEPADTAARRGHQLAGLRE
jgi:ATP-binding cassette subfamily B protein